MVSKITSWTVCFYSGSAILSGMWQVHAQEQEEQMLIEEQLLEQVIDDLGEIVDISEITERLSRYIRKPMDLNRATAEDLAVFVFLTPLQIANFLAPRSRTGNFISLLELQGVDVCNLQTILRPQPFIRLSDLAAW